MMKSLLEGFLRRSLTRSSLRMYQVVETHVVLACSFAGHDSVTLFLHISSTVKILGRTRDSLV